MTKLELLSPAKNLECGIAAIDHGADAVYIGATRFGARAAADNSIEDIKTLCDYAHQFDAKVYVTINTLLHDDELEEAAQLCLDVTNAGADAILIQDLRLLNVVKGPLGACDAFTKGLHARLKERSKVKGERCDVKGENNGQCSARPKGTLLQSEATKRMVNVQYFHASTQTDNRTIEKVQQLSEMGFRRVVLARELSIQEIAAIHKAVPEVELEVFVHGALCVSYSGRCYASEYCFGRSANRGECAQFCRLPFTLEDADGNIIEHDKHLLSLKDFAQLDNLERLVEAGAVSFKIEGRLKDVDYVKNVTAAYSQRLNSIISAHPDLYQRASMGRCTYTFQPDIHKSFNRGFTTYFADGRCSNQASFLTPKSIGEYIGKVKEIRGNSFNVSSVTSFANGDGMCFFSPQGKLIGFRVNRAEGNRIFPHKMPAGIAPGTLLYRNYDQTFQKILSKPSADRKVMLSMTFTVTPTELQLSVTDEHGNNTTATMPYEYQKANTPQEDNIRRQLTKAGGTIYNISHLQINTQVESPFIPSSHLASLRRQALEAVKGLKSKVEGPLGACDAFTKGLHARLKERSKVDGLGAMVNGLHSSLPQELMHCRYCLRHELGYCTKSGRKAPWREPLTLHLADGKSFNIKFDCKQCEMYIMR